MERVLWHTKAFMTGFLNRSPRPCWWPRSGSAWATSRSLYYITLPWYCKTLLMSRRSTSVGSLWKGATTVRFTCLKVIHVTCGRRVGKHLLWPLWFIAPIVIRRAGIAHPLPPRYACAPDGGKRLFHDCFWVGLCIFCGYQAVGRKSQPQSGSRTNGYGVANSSLNSLLKARIFIAA